MKLLFVGAASRWGLLGYENSAFLLDESNFHQDNPSSRTKRELFMGAPKNQLPTQDPSVPVTNTYLHKQTQKTQAYPLQRPEVTDNVK